MKQYDAIVTLKCLSHGVRLDIYELLFEAGLEGLSPGAICDRLDLPSSVVSAQLDRLFRAHLASRVRHGRSVIYSVDGARVKELFEHLSQKCCHGQPHTCDIFSLGMSADAATADESTAKSRARFIVAA